MHCIFFSAYCVHFDLDLIRQSNTLNVKVKEWKIVKKESYETKWKAVSVPVWKDFESNYLFLSSSGYAESYNNFY